MASSQGDVRSSPMATWHTVPSGAAAAKTPATSTVRDADYLFDADYVFFENMTESIRAIGGHPLLAPPRPYSATSLERWNVGAPDYAGGF